MGGKPYQRSGGPFSRGGGGGGGGGGRGGGGGGRGGGGGGGRGGGGGGGGRGGGGGDNRKAGHGGGGNRDRNTNNQNNNGPRQGGAGTDVVGTLLKFMFDRYFDVVYDFSTGVLNLASFRESPDLASAKSAIDFNSVAFCKSLAGVIKNSKVGLPRFINLAGNSINNPSNFLRELQNEGMATSIVGLSFANNNIKDIGFAGALSRFNNLTELSLAGNPIADAHYRRTLAKRVPSLAILDGESIKRPPLGVPYPKHTVNTLSDDARNLLGYLENALFNALATNNTQVLMSTYHPDAIFAFSAEERFSVSTQTKQGTDKAARNDLADLRNAIKDNSANLLQRGATNRVIKGRTQILAAFENSLYHKKFLTQHIVSGDANVSFLGGASVPIPVAVATIHGKMMWLPKAAQDEAPRSALFDRTITLVPTEGGGWQITTDTVYLRRDTGSECLFFSDNPSRIDKLCKAFGSIYPPEIFAAMVAVSESDNDYYTLRDGVPQQAIEQIYLMCDRDAQKCVAVAKTALVRNIQPQDAFNALQAVNFDMSRL